MDIGKGDRVLVNLAPFIGAVLPSKELIPCTVLDVDGVQTHVRTEQPYREVTMWIRSSWIDGKVKESPALASSRR